MCTCGFYNRWTCIKKFQNILEKKLCSCFEQLTLISKKNGEYGIEHDVAYGVCIGTLDIHFWTLQQIWWITCNLSRWWIWQSVSL